MKAIIATATALLLTASTVWAASISASEAKRLNNAATVVQELRDAPDKGIPDDLWKRADCVIVIPDMKKAAFMIGGEYGKGVASCRSGQAWTAPIFVELAKGSAGFQIGGQEVDLVLLVMNRRGMEKLIADKVNLGADASVAAGPVGRTAAASTDAKLTAEILAYSRAQGVFAGVDISGGVLRPDKDANGNAYGASVEPRDVLFGTKVAVPTEAHAFVRTLGAESRATTGKKE